MTSLTLRPTYAPQRLTLAPTVGVNAVSIGAPSSSVQLALLSMLKGDKGEPGGHFQFIQNAPLATWILNHNLGRYVNCTIWTLGGQRQLAEVLQTSVNQMQVIFDAPASGFVVCS